MYDETYLEFMGLANDREHQMFVDRFNEKIGFRGKTLILRVSSESPKGWSASYEMYELAWSSYPRNVEQMRANSQIKIEASRANENTTRSELWSDLEDTDLEKERKI